MQTSLITQSTWYLVAKDPEQGVPTRIAITSPFRVGRREGFDLCLNCRNISGLHAEFIEENGQLLIEDLNSTNGTFINDERIRTRTVLKNGDVLQFGMIYFSVVCAGESEQTPPGLLHNATIAMPETTGEKFQRLLKNGVVPHFQPVFDISGTAQQNIGYEVLGRSRLFGLKTPDQMFATATDLELESELSRVLRLRGIEAAETALPADQLLFVNTHPAELVCSEIVDSLSEIRKNFPSRPIMLELPERVLYTPEKYEELCTALKDMQVQLVIHDFGAGQIRLAELSKLNPDVVKFDCALTQGLENADKRRQQLVSAMVKMVVELGITPMAEYVETEEEHEILKELGFELAQGFYYGHPSAIDSSDNQPAESSQTPRANSEPDPIPSVNRTPQRPIEALKAIEEEAATSNIEINIERRQSHSQSVISDNYQSEKVSEAVLPESKPAAININGTQWLSEQSDDQFTIQVMFSSNKGEAEEFIRKSDIDGDYAIYCKLGSMREWYVVVFGIFDSREQAKTVSSNFENTGFSTWVRSLISVKGEALNLETEG